MYLLRGTHTGVNRLSVFKVNSFTHYSHVQYSPGTVRKLSGQTFHRLSLIKTEATI